MLVPTLRRFFSTFKVSLQSIKKLRQETSAPMGECKKALEQSEGVHEKALLWLKEKGLNTAGKRAEKQTKQGVIATFITPCRRKAVLLEVNCQTDFVAKNQLFLKFVNGVGAKFLQDQQGINVQGQSIQQNSTRFASILQKTSPADIFPQDRNVKSLGQELKLVISRLQENIRIRRAITMYTENCRYGSYVHRPYVDGVGLQACLVELSCDPAVQTQEAQETINQFADDLATQILGSPPKYFDFEQIPHEELEQQVQKVKSASAAVLAKAPQAMHQKIIAGKLMSEYYSKVLLGCMPYLLSNQGLIVNQRWSEVESQAQTNISIHRAATWVCKQ